MLNTDHNSKFLPEALTFDDILMVPAHSNVLPADINVRTRLAGEEALPDTAGPDDYDALPLKEAVGRLPEQLRTVVILRYFSGYTQAETAAALGIPQGTVATRQRRALALLRLELGEEDRP